MMSMNFSSFPDLAASSGTSSTSAHKAEAPQSNSNGGSNSQWAQQQQMASWNQNNQHHLLAIQQLQQSMQQSLQQMNGGESQLLNPFTAATTTTTTTTIAAGPSKQNSKIDGLFDFPGSVFDTPTNATKPTLNVQSLAAMSNIPNPLNGLSVNGDASGSNRLFLETQVGPVQRMDNKDEDAAFEAAMEDDLWKYGDLEFPADNQSQDTSKNLQNKQGLQQQQQQHIQQQQLLYQQQIQQLQLQLQQKLQEQKQLEQQQQPAKPTSSQPPQVPSSQPQKQDLSSQMQFFQQQNNFFDPTPVQQQQQHNNKVPTNVSSAPQPAPQSMSNSHPNEDSETTPVLSFQEEDPTASPLLGIDEAFQLPSTMLPPTVLASLICPEDAPSTKTTSGDGSKKEKPAKGKKRSAKNSKKEDTPKKTSRKILSSSPEEFLAELLKSRGYQVPRISCDNAAYDAAPSALQLASFGTQVVRAVHSSDREGLAQLLSCGISPNPCNQFRDSILDWVCKQGNWPILECLVHHGCDLQVCDGFGRTPLHHTAWSNKMDYDVVRCILDRDPLQLFVEDKRGQTPLQYVRSETAMAWIDFLDEHRDRYWPIGGSFPDVDLHRPNRPEGSMPDPPNACSAELAALISAGTVSPQQVVGMDPQARKNFRNGSSS